TISWKARSSPPRNAATTAPSSSVRSFSRVARPGNGARLIAISAIISSCPLGTADRVRPNRQNRFDLVDLDLFPPPAPLEKADGVPIGRTSDLLVKMLSEKNLDNCLPSAAVWAVLERRRQSETGRVRLSPF